MNKTLELTDAQVVRVLDLCGTIAKIRQEIPLAPQGLEVSLEAAKHLRVSLLAKSDLLLELGALLR